ncbi:hypothetical protein ACVXHB_07680 [Escherichia coli]
MPVLHNRISNDALKAKMLARANREATISFYKYFHIAHPAGTRDALYQLFTALNVFGRVYLAHEGINAKSAYLRAMLKHFARSSMPSTRL